MLLERTKSPETGNKKSTPRMGDDRGLDLGRGFLKEPGGTECGSHSEPGEPQLMLVRRSASAEHSFGAATERDL